MLTRQDAKGLSVEAAQQLDDLGRPAIGQAIREQDFCIWLTLCEGSVTSSREACR